MKKYFSVQIFIAACLNFCEIINGYGVGWAGPVLPKFDDPNQTPLSYQATQVQKTWIATSIFFGFLSTIPGGYLGNRIGRKKSITIGGVLQLIAYLVLSFAKNVPTIIIGRVMFGMSINYLMVLNTIYIGEIATANIRGILLTSMGVSHATGSLLVYCIAPYVSYAAVNYVCVVLLAIFIVASCFLPESPMFYVLKDDESSARSVLQYLGRSEDIESELKIMMEKVHEQKNNKNIWKELFQLKCNRKSLFITVSLTSFQQGSGIMAVILYANTIFRYVGSSIPPDVATIIVGATFVLGALVAPIVIDKYGRRILLKISTIGLCLTMTCLGVFFYLKLIQYPSIDKLGWLPLILLVLAQFSYSFGISIIPNTLSGELFSSKVRGLGPPLSISAGMVTGLVTSTAFGYVVTAVGVHVTFWMFAAVNALAFIFVILFVPETMGKTLTEIQDLLNQ